MVEAKNPQYLKYKDKMLEYQKQNRERINEYMKTYGKQYRAKKKQEKIKLKEQEIINKFLLSLVEKN